MPEKGSEAERIEEDRLPSTLDRSDQKAKDTYAETLASAEESYGDGQRAHRTAWAAVKHTHEKVGDHWEPKEENGPSDERAAGGLGTDADTKGGVDANASKQHLYELAQKAEIPGRSTMSKDELVDALQKSNTRKTAKARGD
jgi:cation transport regulator ChaB